jgi:hypothetical protein
MKKIKAGRKENEKETPTDTERRIVAAASF